MKALFITYHYPPGTAVGGLRIEKFSRYLCRYGYESFVLTIKDEYRDGLDTTRIKKDGGVKVFKTGLLPDIRGIYLWLKKNGGNGTAASAAPVARTARRPATSNGGLLDRLKRLFISLFVTLPDSEKNWVVPAALKAVRLIKKYKIDCVITSSPPHSVHLAGLIVKKLTGVRWLADFRDPWTDTLTYKAVHTPFSDRIEHRMERAVILNADVVLTTTSTLADLYKMRYDLESNRVVYIPNGIDSERFTASGAPEKCKKFSITYAGTLYAGRTPEPIFKALRLLINRKAVKPEDIKLNLIGRCDNIEGRPTEEVVKEYGLENIVNVSAQIPYNEALEIMMRSHLLLLLAPGLPLQVPAKVYDYLGSGTRILAIADRDGATDRLIRSTGAGTSFEPHEIERIAAYIHSEMEGRNRPGGEGAADLSFLAMEHLTSLLASRLSSANECGATGKFRDESGKEGIR